MLKSRKLTPQEESGAFLEGTCHFCLCCVDQHLGFIGGWESFQLGAVQSLKTQIGQGFLLLKEGIMLASILIYNKRETRSEVLTEFWGKGNGLTRSNIIVQAQGRQAYLICARTQGIWHGWAFLGNNQLIMQVLTFPPSHCLSEVWKW